ncbi:MAG: hypothetical protein E6J41_18380 [Chloroflexi bacterium]|nr:MAG: hypothetical protein E6J41_18380 [Chloroflexota bacterium]
MSTADSQLSQYRQLVTAVLNSIPTGDEPSQTIAQIASRASLSLGALPLRELELATAIILVVLGVFDVVHERGDRYRHRGEMPAYFTRSLAWYVANARPLLNNWMRRGVGNDIAIGALLDAAPYLLRIVDDKRLQLAASGIDPAPARSRSVACVLVKAMVDGQSYFLFEWERVAAQYQLIGGGIIADEEPRTAAVQELIEEMVVEPGRHLEFGLDFDIRPLDWDRPLPLQWIGVSRSVGAVTRYDVWAYTSHLKVTQLKLREHCR